MSRSFVRRVVRAIVAVLAPPLVSVAPNAWAQDVNFYRGKTVSFYIGYTAGGAYDLYARLVARHLARFIPGAPTIVPVNMPGGGGRATMGYLFNVAPQDGTAIGTADQSLVLQQAVRDPTILFDINQLQWVGNPLADNNTVAAMADSGVKTIADATRREVVLGSTGANTSSQVPQVMNATLGTRFKIVTGYPGGNDVNLAMERGEVAGRFNSWSAWKAARPDWVRDHRINILTQIGVTKAPDLPDVPLLIDLAANNDDRSLLNLVSAPAALGRQIFTSPKIPPSRLILLRTAFNAMVKDPAFLADAKAGGLDINPVTGEEMKQSVIGILATPSAVVDRFQAIISQPLAAGSGAKAN